MMAVSTARTALRTFTAPSKKAKGAQTAAGKGRILKVNGSTAAGRWPGAVECARVHNVTAFGHHCLLLRSCWSRTMALTKPTDSAMQPELTQIPWISSSSHAAFCWAVASSRAVTNNDTRRVFHLHKLSHPRLPLSSLPAGTCFHRRGPGVAVRGCCLLPFTTAKLCSCCASARRLRPARMRHATPRLVRPTGTGTVCMSSLRSHQRLQLPHLGSPQMAQATARSWLWFAAAAGERVLPALQRALDAFVANSRISGSWTLRASSLSPYELLPAVLLAAGSVSAQDQVPSSNPIAAVCATPDTKIVRAAASTSAARSSANFELSGWAAALAVPRALPPAP